MRRALPAFLLVAGLAGTAAAGDFADRDIVGFSADGTAFAFEEYGVQDGSGFPYSTIYLIDLAQDEWIGSPVRIVREDDTATVADVRRESRAAAGPALDAAGVADSGRVVASNPLGELSADPDAVRFAAEVLTPFPDDGYALELEDFELPPPEDCPQYGDDDIVRGFELRLVSPGGKVSRVHRDTSVPRSRRCANYYAISDIVVPSDGSPTFGVALISVFSKGFEGPDRRFIAVPLPLSE